MAEVYTLPADSQSTSSTAELPTVLVRETRDFDGLHEIARYPQIYPHISNDLSPAPEDFNLPEDSTYFGIYSNSTLVGFWMVTPTPTDFGELHTCILPEGRGPVATAAAPQFLRQVFSHTPFMGLFTRVPASNPAARKFATWGGFKSAFSLQEGWVKGGEAHDLETLYLPLLDWFFRLTTGDVKMRARVLVSRLAVAGQFAKAQFLHATLTTMIGPFEGDR